MNDDGLRCAAITIATQAHVRALGGRCPAPYVLTFITESGTMETLLVGTLTRIAELIIQFAPRTVRVHGMSGEEEENIRAYIASDVREAGVVLH